MRGHKTNTGQADERAAAPRSFLFLQGPISDFFDRLGRALIARGHRVHRVNLHFGDRLFWRLPATNFRGRFDDWRGFISDMLDRHAITDLVLHGDRRPYHIVAAEEARARGIAVIATDLGYVRPDWITLERDGMSTYSRFPREPETIHALAEGFPIPDLAPRHHTPFWLISVLDIIYNLGLVFGRPLYPGYRYHGITHPFAEYFGWVCSRGRQLLTRRAAARNRERLQQAPGSYFIFPLQLPTDFQIRAHSPFVDARAAVRDVIASFARSGSPRKLAIVVHPLDNGLIDWCGLATGLARRFGVGERIVAFEGGVPGDILCHAAGVVTINSTVGTTALGAGVPVKVLGNAVFDIPGLTSQQPLDEFWRDPSPPDRHLNEAFLTALIGATQVKGGYYTRAAQNEAITGFVERLEGGLHPLPALDSAELTGRRVREPTRTVAIAGLADATGLALARACAAPGVRLLLIGASARLAVAAADCRRRGAEVDVFSDQAADHEELAHSLKAAAATRPIDVLAVVVGPDFRDAMATVEALQQRVRRQRGVVTLIGRRTAELLRYSRAAGHQLRPQGVVVSVAAPGILAAWLAARLRHPDIAAIGPDNAARLVCRGMSRRRKTIALPGTATALLRTLRLAPALLTEWLGEADEPVVDTVAEEPLPGRSGTGN
jgi:capsular polysaccharide export protein